MKNLIFLDGYFLTRTLLGLVIGSLPPWHPLLQKGGETEGIPDRNYRVIMRG